MNETYTVKLCALASAPNSLKWRIVSPDGNFVTEWGFKSLDNAQLLARELSDGMEYVPPYTWVSAAEAVSGRESKKYPTYSTGMMRHRDDRPRFDLIFPIGQQYTDSMLYRLAVSMAKGAEKYSERNWEKAETQEELDRFKESAFRHFMQWFHGEADEDHAAALIFNIIGAENTLNHINRIEATEDDPRL